MLNREHVKPRAGFTVLELLIVIGIVAALAAIAFPVFSTMRKRAQRISCTANLRTLYLGAELYVQDKGQWPQVTTDPESDTDAEDNARLWIAALAPYKVTNEAWICPTVQGQLGNPDFRSAGNERIDYTAMTFDDKPTTPHEWPKQPWFVESADVHGHGNLIIFTDGSVSDLKTVAQNALPAPTVAPTP